VTFKVTLAVLNLSNSHTTENIANINYGMFAHELESVYSLSVI